MTVSTDLLKWFAQSGRDLPWRKTNDPFAIWVAEVMLQQTRVDTVLPYFVSFLARFPDVQALAAAPLDEVLSAWEGLGYYARARNLHRAARIVGDQYGGKLPRDPEALRQLPGIGSYTAAALGAIAFGMDVVALEGNLRRVLARLFDIHLDPGAPEGEQELLRHGSSILPSGQASEFNQALMDLGALVCTPRTPACNRCPIQRYCLAFRRGTQAELPLRSPRKPIVPRRAVAAVWALNGEVLIRRRPERGLLGGLWGFPAGFLEGKESEGTGLRRLVSGQLGVDLESTAALDELEHTYTHFKVRLTPYLCEVASGGRKLKETRNWRWVSVQDLPDFPMGKLDRRLAELLAGRAL